MPASNATPEAEGLDVVVLGTFNPAIFHPEWFLRQRIVGEDDAKEARIKLVSNEVSELNICGLRVLCIPDRFFIATSNISKAARMQDLFSNIFTLLPHVPVTACGINPWVHYSVGTTAYWHKIGHSLAPKELIWNVLVEQPGMQSLTIQSPRTGDFAGVTNITVEPSSRFPPGILVRVNYHFSLPTSAVHTGSAELLARFLRSEWDTACALPRRVAETIFERIRPDGE